MIDLTVLIKGYLIGQDSRTLPQGLPTDDSRAGITFALGRVPIVVSSIC